MKKIAIITAAAILFAIAIFFTSRPDYTTTEPTRSTYLVGVADVANDPEAEEILAERVNAERITVFVEITDIDGEVVTAITEDGEIVRFSAEGITEGEGEIILDSNDHFVWAVKNT